ncbi:helix-turn-helix domain-containing protein [Candidatus Microgenomates bacterium]|nr:helix-turn-helix domain-containing protein [Candidatus Microgenomates bacterium]
MFKGISKEVKDEVLEKIKSGIPVGKISEQYGISNKTIYTWLKKGVTEPVSIRELQKLRKENAAMREIIGMLTIEKEKIKKKAEGR